MNVTINGEMRDVPAGLSLAALLGHLEMAPARVAVELNRAIAPRDTWEKIQIQEGDKLEIVHLVGGG